MRDGNTKTRLHQYGWVFLKEPLHLLLARIDIEELFEHGDVSADSLVIADDGEPSVSRELSAVGGNVVVFALLEFLFAHERRADLGASLNDSDHHAAVIVFLQEAVVVGIDLLLNPS